VPVLTKTSYAPIFALSAAIVPLAFLAFRLVGGRVEPVQTQPKSTQE
jgi:ACS family hexuronate transporter-like MFS transporter